VACRWAPCYRSENSEEVNSFNYERNVLLMKDCHVFTDGHVFSSQCNTSIMQPKCVFLRQANVVSDGLYQGRRSRQKATC